MELKIIFLFHCNPCQFKKWCRGRRQRGEGAESPKVRNEGGGGVPQKKKTHSHDIFQMSFKNYPRLACPSFRSDHV